jgi:hypothetical protein
MAALCVKLDPPGETEVISAVRAVKRQGARRWDSVDVEAR